MTQFLIAGPPRVFGTAEASYLKFCMPLTKTMQK